MLLLAVFLVTLLICYSVKKHNYWASRGVYTPKSCLFIGHMHKSYSSAWLDNHDIYYNEAKQYDFFGFYEFLSPKLFVTNPQLIRRILGEDFSHFMDKRKFASKSDKLSFDMLINASGDRWKFLRNTLTPIFTSGKLKAMFPLVSDIADRLVSMCQDAAKRNSPLEVNDALGRYALDVIACCAFGIEGKANEQGEIDFYRHMQDTVNFGWVTSLRFALLNISPKFNLLGITLFSKDTTDKVVAIVKKVIDERSKNNFRRGDFIDLLLEARENAHAKDTQQYDFDENTLMAQSILFLLAAYDTVKTTSTFLMNDLAKHPEEQTKVREELLQLTKEGGLTYQKVMEAKYLDAFICETMRLAPSAYHAERICTQNYKIPGTHTTIFKGQTVDIPIYNLQRDPEYWDDPLEFQPSRFLPENKDKIVPYTYLPFGLGPRNCIGKRFALMEMKLVMAKLVLAFEMSHPAGFEMKFGNTPQSLRPDDKGVMIYFKPLAG